MNAKAEGLSRRRFLRGLGIAMGVPAFESLGPVLAKSSGASPRLATTASGAPLRMAYLYIPNGVNTARWKPTGVGADYEAAETFAPLAAHRKDFQIFSH